MILMRSKTLKRFLRTDYRDFYPQIHPLNFSNPIFSLSFYHKKIFVDYFYHNVLLETAEFHFYFHFFFLFVLELIYTL